MFVSKFLQALPALQPRLSSLDLPRKSFLENWLGHKSWNSIDVYYRLGDAASKELLLKLVLNSLGLFLTNDMEKYRMYSASAWQILCDKAHDFSCIKDTFWSDIVETFVLDGYSYGEKCRALPGDVVLDCGAYTGNTALYFSRKVGAEGKVYAFEAMPKTYEKLRGNISAYKMENVFPVNTALSDKKGELVFTPAESPGSCKMAPGREEGGLRVPATSIDAFVRENRIGRIDFIKMDIEGSELEALTGAAQTIARFKPKLAISVYHRPEDMGLLPEKILELNPAYTFYLKHNYWKFTETVLFCADDPQGHPDAPKDVSEEKRGVAEIWENIFQYKLALNR
ncbi:FkbM family methyltransferase, partial [Desulfovibrio sp.]|uniref:FkbM family methyltransferase n=1 Tax=Desulfovibrio sp. TaxID=885 RepID=UPI0023D32C48